MRKLEGARCAQDQRIVRERLDERRREISAVRARDRAERAPVGSFSRRPREEQPVEHDEARAPRYIERRGRDDIRDREAAAGLQDPERLAERGPLIGDQVDGDSRPRERRSSGGRGAERA